MIGVGGIQILRIAWSGIATNKLRSGLTILGMTIGVASVIVLIAVGNGSSKAVQSRIQSLGTNVLIVMPSSTRRSTSRSSTSCGKTQSGMPPRLSPPAFGDFSRIVTV